MVNYVSTVSSSSKHPANHNGGKIRPITQSNQDAIKIFSIEWSFLKSHNEIQSKRVQNMNPMSEADLDSCCFVSKWASFYQNIYMPGHSIGLFPYLSKPESNIFISTIWLEMYPAILLPRTFCRHVIVSPCVSEELHCVQQGNAAGNMIPCSGRIGSGVCYRSFLGTLKTVWATLSCFHFQQFRVLQMWILCKLFSMFSMSSIYFKKSFPGFKYFRGILNKNLGI